MEIRVFNIYDFSSCVAKPPIKLSSTTKSICLISWPCFLGLFNPQNWINWLGGVQLLSLYLTWWGARYHKSSCTLSINKLKLSRFIQRTPGIIHLNNVNRRSVKIIFPLTGRQNLFWDNLTAEVMSISSLSLSINWVNINFFRNLKSQKKFFKSLKIHQTS